MKRRGWEVEFHPDCERWADGLPQPDQEALLAAIRVLGDQGPTLGRPLVDSVSTSRHANVKELRPGSTGRSEIRVLFAFDTRREAILLLGGDKSGSWKSWYATNVPIADDRLDAHEQSLATDARVARQRRSRHKQQKGRRSQ